MLLPRPAEHSRGCLPLEAIHWGLERACLGTRRSLIVMERITKLIIRLIIKRHQKASVHRLAPEDVERLAAMFASLESGDLRARPSKYWVELNRMNLAQLQQHGYDNF